MTCRRLAGAIVCSRSAKRYARASDPCHWPECDRKATQASWGCRYHYMRLPPQIRDGLWRADRDERSARGELGPAWKNADETARAWIAEQAAKPPRTDRRQPELPL